MNAENGDDAVAHLGKTVSSHGNYKHGLSNKPIYYSWQSAKDRCLNPSSERYKDYGGRGIKFFEKWLSFTGFLEDMGPTWQPGLTIERKDVNGDYCPSNCKWATDIEQANNKRNNRLLEFNGKSQTIPAWSRETGIPTSALITRFYRHKWSVERCLTTPVAEWSNDVDVKIGEPTRTVRPQAFNRKSNRWVTFDGLTLTVAEWARRTGIHKSTLGGRLRKGHSPAEVLGGQLRRLPQKFG